MVFKQVKDTRQLAIGIGHRLFHAERLGTCCLARCLGQILWCANASDHILPLSIDQIFAVIGPLARRRIARKRNARGRSVAHIAEHHSLHIDRRAPIRGDVIQAAINFRAVRIPAVKYGRNRAPELLGHILREWPAQLSLSDGLELRDQIFPVIRFKLGIGVKALVLFRDFQRFFEQPMIKAEHNIGIHLDEAAIAVPGKALVPRSRRQPRDSLIVQTKVENRIHHAGHRDPRARTHGDEQRVACIAEAFANGRLDMGERLCDLLAHSVRKTHPELRRRVCAFLQVAYAFLGRDRKSGRNRQANRGHFGKVRAFASSDRLVLLARIRMIRRAAKCVNCLNHGRGSPNLRSWRSLRLDALRL